MDAVHERGIVYGDLHLFNMWSGRTTGHACSTSRSPRRSTEATPARPGQPGVRRAALGRRVRHRPLRPRLPAAGAVPADDQPDRPAPAQGPALRRDHQPRTSRSTRSSWLDDARPDRRRRTATDDPARGSRQPGLTGRRPGDDMVRGDSRQRHATTATTGFSLATAAVRRRRGGPRLRRRRCPRRPGGHRRPSVRGVRGLAPPPCHQPGVRVTARPVRRLCTAPPSRWTILATSSRHWTLWTLSSGEMGGARAGPVQRSGRNRAQPPAFGRRTGRTSATPKSRMSGAGLVAERPDAEHDSGPQRRNRAACGTVPRRRGASDVP